MNKLQKRIKVISEEDIRLLAKSCEKIRAIKTKKGEERRDYVKEFKEYHELYEKFVHLRDEEFDKRTKKGMKRAEFTEIYVGLIRERQELLGLDKYLINNVKFAFIVNIVHWIEDPTLLDRKREYKPRKKENEDILSKRGKISLLSLTENEITIELINSVNEPMRGIIIESDDGNSVEIDISEDNKTQNRIIYKLKTV